MTAEDFVGPKICPICAFNIEYFDMFSFAVVVLFFHETQHHSVCLHFKGILLLTLDENYTIDFFFNNIGAYKGPFVVLKKNAK